MSLLDLEPLARASFAEAGLPMRLAHSIGVHRASQSLGAHLDQEDQRVVAGAAIVHDIGYAHPDTGLHFLDGANLLHDKGAPADVVWLVRWHSTALWEQAAAGQAGPERPEDIPEVTERRLAMLRVLSLADFTTGPDGLPVTLRERREGIVARYADPGSAVRRALDEGWPWLVETLHWNEDALESARLLERSHLPLHA